jgi:hypothetical protein
MTMSTAIDNTNHSGSRNMAKVDGNTFFYGGEPGLMRGDLVLPSSDLDKFVIADDVPSALFVAAALQRREEIALYEVSPIGEIDDADPGGLANSAFIGCVLKLCSQARIVNEVELQPELIAKVRQMVATPEKSIPNFAERTASARRKYNLMNLQKNLERNKGDARGVFLKKQIKLRQAKSRRKK